MASSKIQLVVYYLYCILIDWATTVVYMLQPTSTEKHLPYL